MRERGVAFIEIMFVVSIVLSLVGGVMAVNLLQSHRTAEKRQSVALIRIFIGLQKSVFT